MVTARGLTKPGGKSTAEITAGLEDDIRGSTTLKKSPEREKKNNFANGNLGSQSHRTDGQR